MEKGIGLGATQLSSSLMMLSVAGLLLPGAFLRYGSTLTTAQPSLDVSNPDSFSNAIELGVDILSVSHGTAAILLWIYLSYLFFMMFSHEIVWSDGHSDARNAVNNHQGETPNVALRRRRRTPPTPEPRPNIGPRQVTESVVEGQPFHLTDSEIDENPGKEAGSPSINITVTIGLLLVVLVLIIVTTGCLVNSINKLIEKEYISKDFVGLILLPIVGNVAGHVTAVTASVKDKSLGVAVECSIQTALFVIPLDIIVASFMDKPLTLLFNPYTSVVLLLTVLTVNYIIRLVCESADRSRIFVSAAADDDIPSWDWS